MPTALNTLLVGAPLANALSHRPPGMTDLFTAPRILVVGTGQASQLLAKAMESLFAHVLAVEVLRSQAFCARSSWKTLGYKFFVLHADFCLAQKH